MITVFADQESPRLHYVLNYVFNHILNIGYQLLIDPTKLDESRGVVISYSKEAKAPIHFSPSGLLFETATRRVETNLSEEGGIQRLLFPTEENPNPAFDPFTAIFFLLSRYEEYVHPKTDHHGRILPEFTWLGKNNLLQIPLVDAWVNELIGTINQTHNLHLPLPKFSSLSTIDLDNGYKYKGKGFKRCFGACLKDLKARDYRTFLQRFRTVFGFRKDDYDIYDWLMAYHQEKKLPLTFFVLNARRGSHDHGLPRNSFALKKLVQKIANAGIQFGIHPSYHSNRKKLTLKHEIEGLGEMAGCSIIHSRQHYLRFRMPTTFENLIELGIKHDYSMGFASLPGFRAGTCRTFYFYNLSTNEPSNLMMHPTTIMEGTYKDYMKMHSADALQPILEMITVVKKYGGEFISIWHEAQLAEKSSWRKLYLQMNDAILSN